MSQDGFEASHPIQAAHPLTSTASIFSLFDGISYDKGACILTMLENYVSREVFFAGIHDYLDAHRFGNAQTSELWDAIAKAWTRLRPREPAVDVAGVAKAFVEVQGYPVVTVAALGEQVSLRAEVFRYAGTPPKGAEGVPQWVMPIAYTSASGNATVTLLDDDLPIPVRPACDQKLLGIFVNFF